jgi:endo-1,4-beta-xylanase
MIVKPRACRAATRRDVVAATLAGLGLVRMPAAWAAAPARSPPVAATSAVLPLSQPVPMPPVPAGLIGPVISPAGPGLGAIAASHGRVYGAAVRSQMLTGDPAYAALVARECGLLMPDYETKWDVLQPTEGHFNFAPLDTLLAWARAHAKPVRGTALVWHEGLPEWVVTALMVSPERARVVLDTHIGRVLARTQGSIRDWDVVNEVVADPAGSEYGTEEAAPHHFEKRRRLLNLVRNLRRANVPLDQVGLQGHLQLVQPFSGPPFTAFCRLLRAEGVELVVTEMDVREHWKLPDGMAARDRAVADRVKAFVDAAIDGGIKTFVTWGLQDKYSWLATNKYVKRTDGLEHRGLPLDDDGNRKLYWQAMADAFARP